MGDFHPGNIARNPGTGAFKWVWIDYADTEQLGTVSMTKQCKQFKKIFLERVVQELGPPHQAIGAEFRCVFQKHSDLMYSQHVDCDQADFKIDILDQKFKEGITRMTNASAVGHLQPAQSSSPGPSLPAAVVKSGAFSTSSSIPAPPWQNITQASSAGSAGVVKSGGTSPISVDRSRGTPPPPWNRQSYGIYSKQESESIPVEDFIVDYDGDESVIDAKNDEHGALSTSLPEALVPSSRAEESGIDAKNDEHGAPSEESVLVPRWSLFLVLIWCAIIVLLWA